jgi:hypothetical protein
MREAHDIAKSKDPAPVNSIQMWQGVLPVPLRFFYRKRRKRPLQFFADTTQRRSYLHNEGSKLVIECKSFRQSLALSS